MSRQRRIVVLSVAVVAIVVAPLGYHGWQDLRRSDLSAKCRDASQRRRWDELQELADRWSAWDSENAEPWWFRAQAASGQRDWVTAVDSFWRVPDSDPRAVPAMIEVSKMTFTHLNNPLRGVQACQRILRNDPRAAGAHQQLIWFYAMTLQREQLLKQIRAATQAQREPPEAYVYFFLADSFRSSIAVTLNKQWLQSTPNEEAFQVAHVLHLPDSDADSSVTPTTVSVGTDPQPSAGRSKRERVAELLKRFPHNLELLAYVAQDRLTTGDVSGAASLLSQAPEAAQHDSRFWLIQGWLHESQNELDEAAKSYRKALKLRALDWNSMNRLAVVERRRQNLDEVQRLTKLVERAHAIRKQLRQLPAIEMVTPTILRDLATLARDCGDQEIAPALERRLSGAQPR